MPLQAILLVGSGGQLGTDLRSTAPSWANVHGYSRSDLDITDASAVNRTVRDVQPDWILNAAAYTAVDAAEGEADVAFAVNRDGVRNLAVAARATGAKLLHVSTDYVFDGRQSRPYRPDDPPSPLSVYGRSKHEGENAVFQVLESEALLVRSAWLYGHAGPSFVKTILRKIRDRSELSVVVDQISTPTWTRTLAAALWSMIEDGPSGIRHWTNAGVASWYDHAVVIQEEALALGLVSERMRIVPIPTAEYSTPAPRPGFSVLDTSKSSMKPIGSR